MAVTDITVSQLVTCKASDAFDAFVEPSKITQFWLSSTTGPLSEGAEATWQFMVPGAVDTVTIDIFKRPSLIQVAWSDGSKTRFEFSENEGGNTKVSITAGSLRRRRPNGSGCECHRGLFYRLCDLKTLLESGRSANLVRAKAELIASSMAASKGDI